MPRKPFVANSDAPYNIGARSNNKDWFALPLDVVWGIMEDYLYFLDRSFNVNIHQFILMNNHFHMMARFPENNLPEAMQYFMRETSRTIAIESKRINHVYGGRHYRREITSSHAYENIYKYNYRNPVEAGLCNKVEDYKFSTLAGLLGRQILHIPVVESLLFDNKIKAHLDWLNKPPKDGYREVMKKALKTNTFNLIKTKNRKIHPLNTELY